MGCPLILPQGYGNHVHVGDFTASSKDASGFSNPAVWRALQREGLSVSQGPMEITLTEIALEYDTGFGNKL